MNRSILFLVVLFLSSCQLAKKEKTYVIGVSQCSEDSWRRSMNEEIRREASFQTGMEVIIKTAFDSNQKQIRDIESFIANKVDLIIVSPNEATPLTPVIEKAVLQHIPVILVDRKTRSSQYSAFVGADNYQIGREVGTYAVNLLNGKGRVFEIRGLQGSTPDEERHKGFRSVIDNYPGMVVVEEVDGEWHRNVAKAKMQAAMQKKESFDLVFAHNDEMALGAGEALQALSGKRPFLIGIDALPGPDGGIQKVLDGALDATFIYPTGGEKSIQIAYRILHGETFEKENSLYTAVVDNTNARVLKLQTDQIVQHQEKISRLNEVLNKNLAQYSSQRMIVFFLLFIVALFLMLAILLFRLYRQKNKANKKLEETNLAIRLQKEEISEQRDQLVTLSRNLEEATQAKLTFFTNISHEFRTPLTLLLGPLESLMKKETLSSEGNKLTQMMKKNIYVLLRLIEQIIEFRRFENGKMQMYYTLGDLKKYLHDITDSFKEISRKKRLHLTFHASSEDFLVWFDSDKLEKICNNLLTNAVKCTPENGHVKLELSKISMDGADFAKVVVSDTGIGISEANINKIFDRFYMVDKTSAGSGIGLALTKVLVEQYGGEIEVKSVENKGSAFTFTIPFKQKDISVTEQYPLLDSKSFLHEDMMTDESEEVADEKEPTIGSKSLILLVEDNSDVRHFVKTLLMDDFEIIEASNGHAGIVKAMKYLPELIISDVMMDQIDGYELCRTIKENITTSHIPVILLTAHALDEHKIIGFESGADAFILKPFNEEILKIRVRKTIENREKVKEHFQKTLTFGDRKDKVPELDKTFMDKFRAIIEEHITNTDLNVDEIGKNLGLSRVQLYRKLKSLTNYAPNELVRIIRLKKAEQYLINSERTISEIAYDTGFSSPSYFTKCFREYFNENPTDYLKRVRP
ncbi:MAG TPA: substrate-binding domain-containing protein [Bacteroidales bacterium]|nr:substrate-binding domain-containing protein [Bacteroidales bacterium]